MCFPTALLGPERSQHATASILRDPATLSASVEISSDTRAAGVARRFTAARLDEWGCTELADAARLICSELATNAAVHGRTRPQGQHEHILLVLTWHPGVALVIQVADNSTAPPVPRASGESADSGRGLGLVSSLADHWTCRPNGDGSGKSVWVCLRPPRPAMAA